MDGQFKTITYTGKSADALTFPMEIYHNTRGWAISVVNRHRLVFKALDCEFVFRYYDLSSTIQPDWSVIESVTTTDGGTDQTAVLSRWCEDRYLMWNKGMSIVRLPIPQGVVEGAIDAMGRVEMYFNDRADPGTLEIAGREMRMENVLMSIVAKLVQRRLDCYSLDTCEACQQTRPVTCTRPQALANHKQCAQPRPTTLQVRRALRELAPHYNGVHHVMDRLIEVHALDVDNNAIEWLGEVNIQPERIRREVVEPWRYGGEDLIPDDALTEQCLCFEIRKSPLP